MWKNFDCTKNVLKDLQKEKISDNVKITFYVRWHCYRGLMFIDRFMFFVIRLPQAITDISTNYNQRKLCTESDL